MHSVILPLASLPYPATIAWPRSETGGQWDWITDIESVEAWLEAHVGSHTDSWAWCVGAFDQRDYCCVSFARQQDSVMFLLRFG